MPQLSPCIVARGMGNATIVIVAFSGKVASCFLQRLASDTAHEAQLVVVLGRLCVLFILIGDTQQQVAPS